MHKTGRYIDLRIVFTHSFEHEISNLVFNLVSLEKKFGAIVNWVLKDCKTWSRKAKTSFTTSTCQKAAAALSAAWSPGWSWLLPTLVTFLPAPSRTPAKIQEQTIFEEVMDYRTYCWAIAKTYCWAIAISRWSKRGNNAPKSICLPGKSILHFY